MHNPCFHEVPTHGHFERLPLTMFNFAKLRYIHTYTHTRTHTHTHTHLIIPLHAWGFRLILLVVYCTCLHTQTHVYTLIRQSTHAPALVLLCQGKATHGRSPTSPEGEGTGGAGPEEEGQIKGDINVLGVCE